MSASAQVPLLSDVYTVVRQLDPGVAAHRTLLKHRERQSAHVAHFLPRGSRVSRDEFGQIVTALSSLRASHVVPIEERVRFEDDSLAFVTPYHGHISGLVTLESLGALRGGRLAPEEIEAAGDHLLHALDDAHGQNLYNGPLEARQILIDRQGRVQIEHFGLARMLGKGMSEARVAREDEIRTEIRSVMEILFRCLTGLDSRTIGVSPSQVVSSLDPLLDEWLAAGLKENAGFESAAAARAAMPEHQRQGPTPSGGILRSLQRLLRIGP